MIRKFILPVLFLISLAGCKEEFYPAIDRQMSVLVVEGMITNLKESYKVKLSIASPYDSATNASGITGASVSINDDLGGMYLMHENTDQKNYYSDPSEFTAFAGRSYSLHIEMPDGEIYESAPQKMLDPATIDSIHGLSLNKEYWYKNILGDIVSKMVFGSQTFMDVSFNSDSIYQFRYDNYLIKCYSYIELLTHEMLAAGITFPPPRICPDVVCPYLMYNWQRYNLFTSSSLSISTHDISLKKVMNSPVCFFPFDSAAFPTIYKSDSCGEDPQHRWICAKIRIPGGPHGDILQTRVYALNQTSSKYYQQLNKQLTADGKLFDPIAVQLQGNMKCVTNPAKPALGLFEVSACTTRSYWLNYYYSGDDTKYYPTRDLSGLPASGVSKDIPDFWRFIFP